MELDLKPWKLGIWTFVVLEWRWGGGWVEEWEGKHERVEGEMKGISKEAESVWGTNKLEISKDTGQWQFYNYENKNDDGFMCKNVIVFVPPNYRIATVVHSKTVMQNCLRMCVIKKFHLLKYKIVTVWHSKTILHNRLRICVVKNQVFGWFWKLYLKIKIKTKNLQQP